MKPEHILLTTDLSPDARRAFEPVRKLAERTDARVTLLHVVYVLTGTELGVAAGAPIALPDYDRDRVTAEEALNETGKVFGPDVDVSTRVHTSHKVTQSILDIANEEQVDLIAMSTHGRRGVRRLVLGSVAEEVVRSASVPVLCFPPPSSKRDTDKIEHILLTTDLSEQALRPFGPVIELAQATGARVTVLHVVPELFAVPHGAPLAPPMRQPDIGRQVASAEKALDEQVAPFRNAADVRCEVITHQDVALGLGNYAKKHDVDLIALSTHGRTGFRRLAIGSIAAEVLRASDVPVLTFNRTAS